jgi:hypothetical protein
MIHSMKLCVIRRFYACLRVFELLYAYLLSTAKLLDTLNVQLYEKI